jgi:hypothetical protein
MDEGSQRLLFRLARDVGVTGHPGVGQNADARRFGGGPQTAKEALARIRSPKAPLAGQKPRDHVLDGTWLMGTGAARHTGQLGHRGRALRGFAMPLKTPFVPDPSGPVVR